VGEGAYGKVFKVQNKVDNKVYAMKILSKKFLEKRDQLKYVQSELNILKVLEHPFIIKLHWSFTTEKYIYFILDYSNNGDLDRFIAKRGLVEEKDAKIIIA